MPSTGRGGPKHTCPRRIENGMHRADSPFRGAGEDLDEYRDGHGLVTQLRGCTYCGSMHPDDFMQAVRLGAEIVPTDKSYKLYVEGLPNPEPDRLFVTSVSSSWEHAGKAWDQLTEAERELVLEHQRDEHEASKLFYSFATHEMIGGKFYTQHLTDEQGWEFHELWGARKVNWGHPGAPYVPLFVPGPSTSKGRQP